MTVIGPADVTAPKAPVPTVPDFRRQERLGNALQRLARVLDELLSTEGAPGRRALRELRLLSTDALHALAASAEESHGRRWGGSFEAGLRAMAAEFGEVADVVPHVRVHGEVERLPGRVVAALREVATEALWNVDRHARAGVLLLSVTVEDGGVTLDVVDDGVDVARRQVAAWGSSVDLGLRRMRRAVEAVGGRLVVRALEPRGLRLSAVVPCAQGGAR